MRTCAICGGPDTAEYEIRELDPDAQGTVIRLCERCYRILCDDRRLRLGRAICRVLTILDGTGKPALWEDAELERATR